jgi:hypothetical protein
VAIPVSSFGVSPSQTINQIRFTDFGGAIGFYLDDISFQVSGNGGTIVQGITQAQADARYWQLTSALSTRDITFAIDGGGSVLTTGVKADVNVDYACTISQVTMLADQSGSVVVDIWKDTYANYPPTIADSITASAKPTISSATKSKDATLTGWTKSIAAGDTLRINVNSVTSITRLNLTLKVTL